jgi:hypothetical protein
MQVSSPICGMDAAVVGGYDLCSDNGIALHMDRGWRRERTDGDGVGATTQCAVVRR